MIKEWFVNGRFPSINLICAGIAALLLYFFPHSGIWPLFLIVLPWGLFGLFNRRAPFRYTALDWFMLLFVVTAVAGVFTAYNTLTALATFWLILGAVLLFYAVTAQPAASPQWLTGSVCVLAVTVTGHFLLSHNWSETPASIAVINRVAAAWMQVRPPLVVLADPNAAEGIMVITLPILLARILWAIRTKHTISLLVFALASILVAGGLLFSTSRGVWLALLVGLSFWALWGAGARFGRFLSKKARFVLAGLLLIGGLVAFTLLSASDVSINLLNRLFAVGTAGDRLQVAGDTLDLIEDFLFTGGGPGAFSGLYSHYTLLIPYFFLAHSHNIFLDISLAQGIGGLLAFSGVLGMTILFLFMPQSQSANSPDRAAVSYLRGAFAASLIALVVHGIVDDPLYSSEGVVFLFLIPGLIVWQYRPEPQAKSWYRSKWIPASLAGSFLLALLLVTFYTPVSARWQANLGAVQMAKVELRDWPDIDWNDSGQVIYLTEAEARFTRALAANPNIRAAYYHMGSIRMLQHQYEEADSLLEVAYAMDPDHRGVKKALGFSYVWAGEPDKALPILLEVPDACTELNTYAWWWRTQGYDDLAERAALLAAVME